MSFLRFKSELRPELVESDIRAEPVVMGNKLKLHQVLVNLIRNASDAIGDNPEGCIRLTLSDEDGQAVITVEDNGCGIPADELQRVWEPFFSTKGDAGNGMGLDIARRLVEAHAGTIQCRSEPGQGTTFTIRLPLAPRPDAERPQHGTAEAAVLSGA
jgi:signal transduction histidine kinase